MIRRVVTDAELDEYVGIWNAITPREPTTAEFIRARWADERRLYVVVEEAGRGVASGFAGPSDTPGRGFVAPRVLPQWRRRGIGSALLARLAEHLTAAGFEAVSAHVDGADEGSRAFAERFGFEEGDRQVEQVRELRDEPPPEVPDGIRLVTIAERPELLAEAYELGREGYADLATTYPVVVSRDEWLRDEATLPEGSFVALAGDEVVGYCGLCRGGDATSAENGLTVVRRSWRRRGLATALKRAELHWAATNGFREIVTWTQRGNDGMRAVNERLGYVYRSVTVTMRRPLPLE